MAHKTGAAISWRNVLWIALAETKLIEAVANGRLLIFSPSSG